MRCNEKKKKRFIKKRTIITLLVGCIVVYLAFSMYFTERFYFGCAINSMDVSGQTVDEVKNTLSSQCENYSLTIIGADGIQEEIKASDIGLKNDVSEEVLETIKSEQSPLAWINSIFSKNDHEMKNVVSYDDNLLNENIDKLQFLNEENMKKPTNPQLVYRNYKYEILPEDNGKYINKEILVSSIKNSIENGEATLNLEEIDCYEKPEYTSQSQEVLNAEALANKYVASKITFKFNDQNKYIDGETINKWINIDNKYNVTLDENKIGSYVSRMMTPYNTIGKTRTFDASTGNSVSVSGGDYGRVINVGQYKNELISKIKEGKDITLNYNMSQSQSGKANEEIGNSYVEINLTTQHIWCYRDGGLVTEGDIVTGNLSKGWGTPQGIYRVKSKESNRILRGPGYESHVNFWMPFNGGIGLHDAAWRSTFGSTIYKDNGSHGCINLPYEVASQIYSSITVGDPVICYFE